MLRKALALALLLVTLDISNVGLPLIFDEGHGQARGQSTLTQQSPTMATACVQVQQANGTAQQTITVTPPAGQFFYMCGLDFQYCASGSAATATNNVYTTTTGFVGNPRW